MPVPITEIRNTKKRSRFGWGRKTKGFVFNMLTVRFMCHEMVRGQETVGNIVGSSGDNSGDTDFGVLRL